MANPLNGIAALGQSVWYDNLGRELVRSGELQRLIEEDGITGVTSNPTIFERSISNERVYDHDIHLLVDTGLAVEGIYEALAVADIREAADLLLPVYKRTSGEDGYVSLEVSPHLAYDTAGTVEQARRLFGLVDRRNLLIKVPGTPQGIDAVRELIAHGVNVNVTLIFSVEQYRDAADAYVEGLERWIADDGDPRHVASVASFFVSRLDTAIDRMLKDMADPERKTAARNLVGKAAIANAKIAYTLYREVVHGERFADLSAKGARPQRIVWASTSTKDADFPDIYYVEALIGPETVNTIPTATLNAYRNHGRPATRLQQDLDRAREVFPSLADLGIDMEEVTDTLLFDGVKAFAESYDLLLDGIAKKRRRLLRGWGHRSASLGDLQKAVDESLTRCDKERISERMWDGDVSLWTEDPECGAAITQRLGWLTIVETMASETTKLKNFADEVRSSGFKTAVLLGMGGSSLASDVFITCFGAAEGYLDLKVLDTTVPDSILEVERGLDLERTLFIVASKSGGTIEVASLSEYFWDRMKQIRGNQAGSHFIVITDPGTSLGKLAADRKFRKTFLNPADIGGRFSALSYFGLVPAALIGMDIDRFIMRAAQAVESAGPEVPTLENQGFWLGTCAAEAALAGRDKLTLIISPAIGAFGCWLEQLIAESTGKSGVGILPVDSEPLGTPDRYASDRLFVYLRVDDDGTHDQEVSVLEQAGHPVITLRLHTPFDLGREMFRWELATALAGIILQINPFDEPNVTESKQITKRFLETYQQENRLPDADRLDVDDPALAEKIAAFLQAARPGDYAAFNVFMRMAAENREMLQSVRALVRDRFRIATTVGFGPRYLHSTGQFHKGGPDKGLFFHITCEDAEDIAIPGAPYSFGVLKAAQGLGDGEALKHKRRRIIRIHLQREADLAKLLNAMREVVA
ncbi:MAG: bifunctional transaldolase/phosoglucose isomerase [Desulfomonile tiedjei]|nr:bifunctional transaldolase/phosoglucose isomerase [Desulfomonile tiedjei]